MRASQPARIVLAVVILAGLITSCGLIAQGMYLLGLTIAAMALTVSIVSHYCYSIRPISEVVAAIAPQLEQVGFEPCDENQLHQVGRLLDQTRTLSDRPVEVLQAAGARCGALSVVWVQYVARRNLQMGFAWLAGFPIEFRGPGRLIPRLNGHADSNAFEEVFQPDSPAIDNLLGEMSLRIRRELSANPHFVYEFNGPHLLADFYVSRDTCEEAKQEYFDRAVPAFLQLLETIEDDGGAMFKRIDAPAGAQNA